MGKIIAGMASSHAATLEDPTHWDDHRSRNRAGYARRYGALPPEQPAIAAETPEDTHARYARIQHGLAYLRERLEALRPDALIIVGDDQNENFTEANLPQIAVYRGGDFLAKARDPRETPARYACATGLAEAILDTALAADVDMASVAKFPDDVLLAHAFGPILRTVDPEARVPVVPIFVNAIHVPAPSPRRCYAYGQTIRKAVENYAGADRVVVYASGGMSHFTAGYPWAHYHGPYTHGGINVDFDRWLMDALERGDGHAVADLSQDDIIGNGEIELRSWITMLGAIGDARPELLVYEPFYRAIMGMAVGYWELEGATSAETARAGVA
jgi:aromatic ring-opening dioxygenase catalytic subunit (LigB family)